MKTTRLRLNITSDTVRFSEWAYNGISVWCAGCGARCKDVTPLGRHVWEPMIYRCKICLIDWEVEDTTDYREKPKSTYPEFGISKPRKQQCN